MTVIKKAIDPLSFPFITRVKLNNVEYFFSHQVGIGAFTRVFQGEDEWGNRLVIKAYNIENKDYLTIAQNEIKSLSRFHCAHVPEVYASFKHHNTFYIVMSDEGIPSSRLIYASDQSRQKATQFVASCLLQVLNKMHSKNFFHGDINPQNVLIKFEKNALTNTSLVDFAFCRTEEQIQERPFARWILPPEYYLNNRQLKGAPIDIWHAGLVMLQILSAITLNYDKQDILDNKPVADALALKNEVAEVVALALNPLPEERPTAIEFWRKLKSVALK